MNLSGLRFRYWDTPGGVAPSALFHDELRAGVYVLGFVDGEEYVGQTVNFPSRFAAHRRRWPDIRTVRFAPVTVEGLDAAERSLIQQRVDSGKVLRNLTLLSQPTGASALDLVVDRQVQAAWLSADADSDDIDLDPHRLHLAERRLASRQRVDQLRGHPLFPLVRTSLAAYVQQVIPWPEETEGKQWILTALPTTARSRDNRRLATLSIQNVEMVFFGERRDRHGEWVGYTRLNTAPLPWTPRRLRRLCEVHDHYRSAGRVQSFDIDGCDGVSELLGFPEVRHAARRLALGQLRKGRGMFARAHNDTFADEVFAEIARRGEPREEPKAP